MTEQVDFFLALFYLISPPPAFVLLLLVNTFLCIYEVTSLYVHFFFIHCTDVYTLLLSRLVRHVFRKCHVPSM